MTSCAITGAGGMIGRHLVGELLPAGVRVRALLLHGEPVPAGFDDVEIVRGDVRDRAQMAAFVAGCDTVYHLAALVGRDANAVSFDIARDVNVNGTRHLLDAARATAVERFVFLSTCCVYGLHGLEETIVDEMSPRAPLDLPYDMTKTEAERLVHEADPSDVPWSILQIPVALGGIHTVDKPTAMSLIRLARMGIAPQSSGRTSWANYVFGRDAAAALVALAQHPSAIGQTFIHSESAPLDVMVSWIADELGVRCRPVKVPAIAFDAVARANRSAAVLANRRRFTSAKIESTLGFIPPVGLECGVRETVLHYRAAGLL